MKIKATHLVLDFDGEMRMVYETEEGLYFFKDTVNEYNSKPLVKERFEEFKNKMQKQYL